MKRLYLALLLAFVLAFGISPAPAQAQSYASATLRLRVECNQSWIRPPLRTYTAQVKPNNQNVVYSWGMSQISTGTNWRQYEVVGFLYTNTWYSDRYIENNSAVIIGWQSSWQAPTTRNFTYKINC